MFRVYSHRKNVAGQSSSTYGYTSGGNTGAYSNVIDKFSFSSDENATDVGDLTVARYGPAGQSSSTYGYTPLPMVTHLEGIQMQLAMSLTSSASLLMKMQRM